MKRREEKKRVMEERGTKFKTDRTERHSRVDFF